MRYIIYVAMIMLLLSSVSAYTFTYTNIYPGNATTPYGTPQPTARGWKIVPTKDINLGHIQIDPSVTANRAIVTDAQNTTLAYATLTNDVAYVNINLTAGNAYYIMCNNSDGSAFTWVYSSAVGLPIKYDLLNITAGYGGEGSGDQVNDLFNIMNITVSSYGPSVTLNSPEDNYLSVDGEITFNCSAETLAGSSLVNMSLILDSVRNSTLARTGANNESIFQQNLSFTSHTWTCEACDDAGECNSAAASNILTIGWKEEAQSYSEFIAESSIGSFGINITYNPAVYTNLNAVLIYNNTRYTGSKLSDYGNAVFSKDVSIPAVPADTNKTFWWEINFINSTASIYENSTNHTQQINNLAIDACVAYQVPLLNMTLRDEETRALLTNTYNTSVAVDVKLYPVDDESTYIQFAYNWSGNYTPQVCFAQNIGDSVYEMDAQIRYGGDGYAEEFYYIQKRTITNSTIPINIDLYDLKDSDNTNFLVTFKDSSFVPVEDALIQLTRKYVGDGIFRTVEILKTDSLGQATGHFDTNSIEYTIIVTQDGVVLATFNNVAVKCQDTLTGECNINLDALTGGHAFPVWDVYKGLNYVMGFDMDTRTVSVIFSTTDGSSSTVLLNTTKFDRFSNLSVCYDSATVASGTLTCTIPTTFGNMTVVSELYKDGELVTRSIYVLEEDSTSWFGYDGVIMAAIIVITIPLMFISSTIGVILGLFLAVVFVASLTLINTSTLFGSSSAIIGLIIAGGILIWKIASR